MKTELIERAPIDAALAEIIARESAQSDQGARSAWADARAILESAIAEASNPEFSGGLDLVTYAELKGIKPDTLRKQIKRGKREAVKRGGRYFLADNAA